MTEITHPRYADGTPILLGDTVRYTGEAKGPARWGRMVVVQVQWPRRGEAWIYTDTGAQVVFTAEDLTRVDVERHVAQPGRCTRPYQPDDGDQIHECNRRTSHNGPDCRCRCGVSWPGGGR